MRLISLSSQFDGLLIRSSVDKEIIFFYSFVKETPGHTSMQARDHLQFSAKFGVHVFGWRNVCPYVYTQKFIELWFIRPLFFSYY